MLDHDVVVAKDIICTFVVSSTAIARVLGVDRRNIKKALARRL
jgi:predicted regulator of amino acid metabolism with ACT domain